MKSQKDIFKASEADEWFNRNKESYKKNKKENDIIVSTLNAIEIKPNKVLEIGSANGERLNKIHKYFGSECFGIDPSLKAVQQGKDEFKNISLEVGSADSLPFDDNKFDVIIFGFCLYLCDREDLFKIAYEADRCLSNKGHIVILDFHPPFPYKNAYTHKEGISSFKMNYSKLFTWNPAYNEISNTVLSHSGFSENHIPNEKVALTILSKREEFAYPTEPY